MARVKLLRQTLEDYNKKITALDTAYQQQYGVYAGQADAYNAKIEAFNVAMGKIKPGFVYEDESGRLKEVSPKGEIRNYSAGSILHGPLPTISKTPEGVWQKTTTIEREPAVTDENGKIITPAVTESYSSPIKVNAIHPGTASTLNPPTQPTPPMAPNLTQGDMRELRAPSLDQAGMQMAANKGIIGKSELTGMEQSKISAFTDPEDPSNLKEAGILARTLGGQL